MLKCAKILVKLVLDGVVLLLGGPVCRTDVPQALWAVQGDA